MDCFHELCLSGNPSEYCQVVEILGVGWPGIISLRRNKSGPWEIMPEVFNCSTLFEKLRGASFLEQNRTFEYLRHNFPWDRLISPLTDNLWPSYSQNLNPPDNLLRGYLKDRVRENNPQAREGIIRKEIIRIPQEMLSRVVKNFNVRVAAVLSYSRAVHGTNIVLITEKVW